MTFTRRGAQEVRAVLLSVLYYAWGLLGALVFSSAFDLGLSSMFAFSAEHLPLIALGIIGEISLANLLVSLYCEASNHKSADRFVELDSIPWLEGLKSLPRPVVPVAAAVGGAVEETFFRGVLLQIMMAKLLVPPLVSVTATGALFWFQQLLQVKTSFQAAVISSGCIAISLVGGLLVVHTGSVVPSILCHASFVVFFVRYGDVAQRA